MTMEQDFYDKYKAWVNTLKYVTVNVDEWRGIKQEHWDTRQAAWTQYCAARDALHGMAVRDVVLN